VIYDGPSDEAPEDIKAEMAAMKKEMNDVFDDAQFRRRAG